MNDNFLLEILLNLLVLLFVKIILLEKPLKVFLFGIQNLVAEGAEVSQLSQLDYGLL